jgi:hypothetical protein
MRSLMRPFIRYLGNGRTAGGKGHAGSVSGRHLPFPSGRSGAA